MIGRSAQRETMVAALAAAAGLMLTAGAEAGPVRRPATAAPPATATNPPPVDDLYRRKGYGMGGLTFGGGQGGTAQAGACADMAFANSPRCGARGGYGIYGNGLGYGFGL